VNAPGSYTVSGLSTITSALFAAGGVRPIGSLRDIQLRRAGYTVRHLDLYDLLMRGDTSNDAHLLPGDVIFIPTIGATVAADGEVRRPGIYELKGATSTADLIMMAGGLTVDADARRGALERVDERQRRIALDVDFTASTVTQELRNGDVLRVARLRPTLDSGVIVKGEIFRPGAFAWHEGLKLTDVLGSVSELKPDADQHYLLIRREQPPDRHIAVLSADLVAALKDPGSSANVRLEPQDQITVFDLQSGRERVIKPLMDELKLQASLAAPTQAVTVSGKVKVAGDYPLEIGMKVSDLVRAGGSLDDAAYGGIAELSRYVVENGQARRTEVIPIDLAAALRGDPAADLRLQPYDGLYVKEISGWSEQEQVTLGGEVRFPGTYPIKRGETLKSVLERAGGLTELAFARGSVFTRAQLRLREQEEINRLTDRMQNELAATSLMLARSNQSNSTQTYTIGQSLLGQLKASRAVGRLVINLEATIQAPAGSPNDIVLRNGDQLIVPKLSQEVTVIGEVQNVTSHLYQPKLGRDDYVQLSGGTTRLADRGRIYVVRADGSVVAASPAIPSWFRWILNENLRCPCGSRSRRSCTTLQSQWQRFTRFSAGRGVERGQYPGISHV
jgi:polysaccharide biosynthesis/export protein